jgi:hypothetical protein
MNRNNEIGSESDEVSRHEQHRLESPDDIVREISDRRLHAEFSESIPSDRAEIVRQHPDHIENAAEFRDAAARLAVERTEGVLGISTNLESPAHILRGEVPVEIATGIHEDLHRLTDERTLREMTATPELRDLYEGMTEFLTERAVTGLHGHESGECYPDAARKAGELADEVGETNLRNYFFQNEMSPEILKAIQRLSDADCPG